MVWCDVVWCGVVWCGVVLRDMVVGPGPTTGLFTGMCGEGWGGGVRGGVGGRRAVRRGGGWEGVPGWDERSGMSCRGGTREGECRPGVV